MEVVFHPHARERLAERGVTEDEAVSAVKGGERFSAKFGRVGFRRNFSYGKQWRGKYYATKQVEVFAVEESHQWVAITTIARYF